MEHFKNLVSLQTNSKNALAFKFVRFQALCTTSTKLSRSFNHSV